ncbi:hypothetical protein [Thermocoleostomius sinensis]|uniref:Uncharacterized protein n=1 Tax=Thermocoleostomius sinensis A174 TaxID=2016057 RepID=A0A9E9CB90_9CYAN|nr:hypothetical protein [Thermocoleostomius sinensis]WAL60095.1 hypothetical protein OXH18_23470 [Thermocoleostomius sinensis A174]
MTSSAPTLPVLSTPPLGHVTASERPPLGHIVPTLGQHWQSQVMPPLNQTIQTALLPTKPSVDLMFSEQLAPELIQSDHLNETRSTNQPYNAPQPPQAPKPPTFSPVPQPKHLDTESIDHSPHPNAESNAPPSPPSRLPAIRHESTSPEINTLYPEPSADSAEPIEFTPSSSIVPLQPKREIAESSSLVKATSTDTPTPADPSLPISHIQPIVTSPPSPLPSPSDSTTQPDSLIQPDMAETTGSDTSSQPDFGQNLDGNLKQVDLVQPQPAEKAEPSSAAKQSPDPTAQPLNPASPRDSSSYSPDYASDLQKSEVIPTTATASSAESNPTTPAGATVLPSTESHVAEFSDEQLQSSPVTETTDRRLPSARPSAHPPITSPPSAPAIQAAPTETTPNWSNLKPLGINQSLGQASDLGFDLALTSAHTEVIQSRQIPHALHLAEIPPEPATSEEQTEELFESENQFSSSTHSPTLRNLGSRPFQNQLASQESTLTNSSSNSNFKFESEFESEFELEFESELDAALRFAPELDSAPDPSPSPFRTTWVHRSNRTVNSIAECRTTTNRPGRDDRDEALHRLTVAESEPASSQTLDPVPASDPASDPVSNPTQAQNVQSVIPMFLPEPDTSEPASPPVTVKTESLTRLSDAGKNLSDESIDAEAITDLAHTIYQRLRSRWTIEQERNQHHSTNSLAWLNIIDQTQWSQKLHSNSHQFCTSVTQSMTSIELEIADKLDQLDRCILTLLNLKIESQRERQGYYF